MIDLTRAKLPQNMRRFVKKPIIIQAMQVLDPFVVDTLEGRHTGQPGDYLVVGIKGERYPVRKDIFEESYEEIPGCKA